MMHQDAVPSFYPLSPLQEGILFDCLASERKDLYFNQCQFTLRGSFDVAAFRESWEQVVTNNDALRTFFVWADLNAPVQVVDRTVELPLVLHDLRELDGPQQVQQCQQLLDRTHATGFDLTRAPLLKIDLLQLADDLYEVIWSFHQLILDGWSAFQVLHQVFSLYESTRTREPITPVVPRPYRDFIAHLKRHDPLDAEEYWRERLRGFNSPTLLGNEPKVGSENPNTVTTGAKSRLLPPSDTSSLNQLLMLLKVFLLY